MVAMERLIAVVAVLAGIVSAIDSTTTVSSGPAATHTIKVGWPVGQNNFFPNVIVNASVGATIRFSFQPQNHSVVKGDAENPCIPYDLVHKDGPMWWSGFQPTNTADSKHYDIKINDTEPVWFYCSAPGSCNENQMLGIINPPDTNGANLSALEEAASQLKFSLSPGENVPPESSVAPSSEGSGASPSSSPNSGGSGSSSVTLSSGAIAGIAIGGVVALALMGLLFFFVGRKKKGLEQPGGGMAAAAVSGPDMASPPMDPPMYHDPRYTYLPPDSPSSPPAWGPKPEMGAASGALADHPHRISELASQNYDPVELYTPGMHGTSPAVGRGDGPRLK